MLFRSTEMSRRTQIAEEPLNNEETTKQSLGHPAPPDPIRRPTPAPTTGARREEGTESIEAEEEAAPSPTSGFTNLEKRSIRDAHMTLWLAGRGPAPSMSSTSRSGAARRRRRRSAPDLPPASLKPSTSRHIHWTTASHNGPTAAAPAHQPPPFHQRWRRRRRDAEEERDQKSITRSLPTPQRSRLDNTAPDPPPSAPEETTGDGARAYLFISVHAGARDSTDERRRPKLLGNNLQLNKFRLQIRRPPPHQIGRAHV